MASTRDTVSQLTAQCLPNSAKSSTIRRALLLLPSASPTQLQQELYSLSYPCNIFLIAMAYKPHSSLLPLIAIFVILAAIAGQAVAGRNIPRNPSKDDKKRPQFLIGHDGSLLIPGFGRVLLPPLHKSPHLPYPGSGSSGSRGSSGGSRNYVPGGDDTFVPNPGYEAPFPGRGGGSTPPATSSHP